MVKLRSPEYREAVRKVGEAIAGYSHCRHFDENTKLVYLERAVESQREAARLEAEFIASLEPCRACGRRVTSPCHNSEGFYEGGPWDEACQDQIKSRA